MANMPDYSQILRLANSPEGRKLIALLQTADSDALHSAMQKAQAGDYEGTKSALDKILSTPEAKLLLQQFGR